MSAATLAVASVVTLAATVVIAASLSETSVREQEHLGRRLAAAANSAQYLLAFARLETTEPLRSRRL